MKWLSLTLATLLSAACGPTVTQTDAGSSDSGTSSVSTESSGGVGSAGSANSTTATDTGGSTETQDDTGTPVTCDPVEKGKSFCTTPDAAAFITRVYVLQGAPKPFPSCNGIFAPCGGELDGTTWDLVDACRPQEDGPAERWDCMAELFRTESYEETATLTFENGIVTNRFSYRWEYGFLTDSESCGVDSCAEVEACASVDEVATATCTIAGAGGCRCAVVEETLDPIERSSQYFLGDGSRMTGVEATFDSLGSVWYCREDDVLRVWVPNYQYPDTQHIACPPDGSPCPGDSGTPDYLPAICASI